MIRATFSNDRKTVGSDEAVFECARGASLTKGPFVSVAMVSWLEFLLEYANVIENQMVTRVDSCRISMYCRM